MDGIHPSIYRNIQEFLSSSPVILPPVAIVSVCVHVQYMHACTHMCEPLWSGHLIPVRLLDDCIGCAVFPPTAVLRDVCKCVCLCVSHTVWHSCSFAQKSDTIMTGPSVHLSVCVRECLLVSMFIIEKESWMENWFKVYNRARVLQSGWALIAYSHDRAELYLQLMKWTSCFHTTPSGIIIPVAISL